MTSDQMISVPLIWYLGHVRKGLDVFAGTGQSLNVGDTATVEPNRAKCTTHAG